MAKGKQPNLEAETKIYRTFKSNLYKLAYFLGTTEGWYEKQVRILAKQVRKARKELPQIEIQIDELLKRRKLSKIEEKRFNKLAEREDDLTDIDIFVPLDTKGFRQFSELIRVLGLSYLVTTFETYLTDVHNMGIVNRRYIESVKESKLKVGVYKSITKEYLRASFGQIGAFVKFIDAEMQRKYFAGQES